MQRTLMYHDSRQNRPKIDVGMILVQIFAFVDKFNSASLMIDVSQNRDGHLLSRCVILIVLP